MNLYAWFHRFIVLTVLVLAVASAAPAAFAGERKIEGSWVTLVTATDPPGLPAMQGLMTFTRDGGVLESRRLYVPPPFGPLLETGGHGAWERVAHHEVLVKFIFLLQAAPNHPVLQNGEPLGTDNIFMRVRVDQSGDTFTGTFVSQARDPQGNLVFTAQGTVQGTRIRPEPLP
jgi:hypothetical protein